MDGMDERMPDSLRRLWAPAEQVQRKPRLNLSAERIVSAAIDLADNGGLDAVSMARVADRLGFTTMSLYRHVASKDELLVRMHDTAWRPPTDLDAPVDGWRAGLERWSRALRAVLGRHPWLEEIRVAERMGTPSQVTWMDRGLRALSGTTLTEYDKTQVLLLLNGLVFADARTVADLQHAARASGVPLAEAAAGYGALMRAFADAERFPALRQAVDSGIFDPAESVRYLDFDADFTFGLERILDGVESLVNRRTREDGTARTRAG